MSFRITIANRLPLACAFLFCFCISQAAQTIPPPRRETLLNGLRLVMSPRAGDDKVRVHLRIHSGAAFDLAGKTGTMALLADTLIFDPAAREAIERDQGGRLTISANHDSLNVVLSAEPNSLQALIDLVRSALLNPVPEAERINALRDARVKSLNAQPGPAALADQLALARLFGAFPYARDSAGVAAELAKVDRNDLVFARERFLNPDNATLIIAGNFDANAAYRIVRQLLGNWRKSDRLVPSTFRQPDTPDDRVLLVHQADAQDAQVRLILRGVARNNADYFALALLADIARQRWAASLALPQDYVRVRHEARTLPGFVLMSGKVQPTDAAKTLDAARATLEKLAAEGPVQAELDRARAALVAELNQQINDPDGLATLWQDVETYRLPPLADQLRALNNLTPNDLKRAAFRYFKAVPMASVALGPAEAMRAELEKTAKIETYGEKPAPPKPAATPSALAKPTPAKP
jgi:zinc protease